MSTYSLFGWLSRLDRSTTIPGVDLGTLEGWSNPFEGLKRQDACLLFVRGSGASIFFLHIYLQNGAYFCILRAYRIGPPKN